MPNQPRTPNRSIRIDPTAWANASIAVRKAGGELSEAIRRFTAALATPTSSGVSLEALAAADAASWFDVHMPRPEAERRLVKALEAAAPLMRQDWKDGLLAALADATVTVTLPTGEIANVVRLEDVRRLA